MLELNDIMLEAIAEVQEVVREMLDEIEDDQQKRTAVQKWMTTPDELKEKLVSEDPDTFKAIMSAMNERQA